MQNGYDGNDDFRKLMETRAFQVDGIFDASKNGSRLGYILELLLSIVGEESNKTTCF